MKTITPQLAEPLDPDQLPPFVSNNDWWFEQKLDGYRLLIHADEGVVTAVNRRGQPIAVPPALQAVFNGTNGQWSVDGELVEGVYWIFDLPRAANKPLSDMGYSTRRGWLEVFFDVLPNVEKYPIKLVPVARTTAEKRRLLAWCKKHNAEGIVLKRTDATYRSGRRTPDWRKAKFTATVDCLVRHIGREGKASADVSLLDPDRNDPVDIGAVKLTDALLATLRVGQVIEVKYLYVGANGRLYQPRFVRTRSDKGPLECTIDQLDGNHVNRAVYSPK